MTVKNAIQTLKKATGRRLINNMSVSDIETAKRLCNEHELIYKVIADRQELHNLRYTTAIIALVHETIDITRVKSAFFTITI